MTAQGNYLEQDAASLIHQIIDGVAYLHKKGVHLCECAKQGYMTPLLLTTPINQRSFACNAGIVHRDLKLENILLLNHDRDAPIKIADFGLSKNLAPNDVLSTMCGSPQYVAPEILEMGDGTSDQYSPACDMWSVGVILFILLSGYSPFGEAAALCCARRQALACELRPVMSNTCADQSSPAGYAADDDVDAMLFRKIKSGKYDADDPIWDGISASAKDLVVSGHIEFDHASGSIWQLSVLVFNFLTTLDFLNATGKAADC